MKNQIVLTQFLEDIVDALNLTANKVGAKNFHFTVADLGSDYTFSLALEMCEALHNQDEANEELCKDLVLLGDLETVAYANPENIASSIETLSELLSVQLEGRLHNEAHYNEYYCKRLAEVLAELCELVAEA